MADDPYCVCCNRRRSQHNNKMQCPETSYFTENVATSTPEQSTASGTPAAMSREAIAGLQHIRDYFAKVAALPSNDQPHYPGKARPFSNGDLRHNIEVLDAILALTAPAVPVGEVERIAVNQNDAMRQELAQVGNLVSELARAAGVDQADADGQWPNLAGRIGKIIAALSTPTAEETALREPWSAMGTHEADAEWIKEIAALEATMDGLALRTCYDADADENGRDIIVGGEEIVRFEDSSFGEAVKDFLIHSARAALAGDA